MQGLFTLLASYVPSERCSGMGMPKLRRFRREPLNAVPGMSLYRLYSSGY